MENSEILKKPFNIEVHKKNFINYLEVVISSKGVIKYAVPSHNGYLEKVLKRRGINPHTDCPKEYYADYYTWLCKMSGYIMVWGKPNSRIIGSPNQKQIEVLEKLKKEDLF